MSVEKTIRVVANKFYNGEVKSLPVEHVAAFRAGTINPDTFFHLLGNGKGVVKAHHEGSPHEQGRKKRGKSRPKSGPKRRR